MSKKIRFVGVLLFVIYLVATLLTFGGCNKSDQGVWQQLLFLTAEAREKGYMGGTACQHLTYLARAKTNKNVMYFGTDAAGICRSFDGGKTWEPCNYGLFTSGVSTIEIDPKNEKHVVVLNATSAENISKYTALFYTLDGGDSWTKCEGTQNLGISASHYYYDSLEFDPRSYNSKLGYCTDLYFSTPCERDRFPALIKSSDDYKDKRGVYKSTDGGMYFEKIEGTEDLRDSIITIHNNVISFGNDRGLFTMKKGKISKVWEKPVHSVQYVNSRYYLLSEDGVYTSKKLATFDKLESDNFDKCYEARNLVVSAKDPKHMVMYAKKQKNNQYAYRPYYSHDGGKTWNLSELKDNDELFYNYTYHAGVSTFDPKNANTIVSIIGGEVIRSTDGGQTWNYSGSGVHNLSVGGQFHFNIYDENLCLMGGYDFGGALTTDGGKTWTPSKLSKDGDGRDIMGAYAATKDILFGVYVDTWSPGDYFRDYRYVCFSHDGGKTVNIDPAKIKENNNANAPLLNYAQWNVDRTISTGYESSYQSPADRQVLFCANFRSTDNGYTWTDMLKSNTSGEKCLQVYTHDGKTLYGCSKQSGYVLKSTDSGATWQKVNQTEIPKTNITSSPSHIVDIAVDSQNGYIYVAYFNHLYRMKTDGTDIIDLTQNYMCKDNFGTYRIRTVAVDPNFPNIVYTGGSGDFYMSTRSARRSMDCGEHWETIINNNHAKENNKNPDLEPSVVTSGMTLGYETRYMRVRSDGTVWCCCLCLGICTLKPPYTAKDLG